VAIPGFGIFGIMGVIMAILGVIFTIIGGASLVQALLLTIILVIVALILIYLLVQSARFGLLGKTGIVDNSSSVPQGYSSDKNNHEKLLGKKGVVETACKPVGKVTIEDLSYQVFSNGPYIPKGSYVKVIQVDGSNIVVKKI